MEISTISVPRLALSFIPVAVVVVLMWRWGQGYGRSLHAIARMLLQLMLIGYVLVYIFQTDSALIISGVLSIMVCAASWIALNTVDLPKSSLFAASLISVLIGGGSTLVLITQGVLALDPWYLPSVMIPLAGMIFANSMNSVSLAGERLYSELGHRIDYARARNTAFQAAMIPITNSLLAVGLVSLPGMMTGQILAGTSPLVAARYQIIVMCMVFSSAGISTALFLWLIHNRCLQQESPEDADSCG